MCCPNRISDLPAITNARRSDAELFRKIEKTLYVPVVSDSLDSLGHRNQAMGPHIRPLRDDFRFVGRARTVLWMDVYEPDPRPYDVEIKFMDSLKPGDVVVTNADPRLRNAPWGELMSTAAKCRGAVGAVIDSCVRDVKKILTLNFPVFATGISPIDSAGRGRVADYDVPVECAGVNVRPGEMIFADYDGIVAVPTDAEEEALRMAFEKVSKENRTRDELLKGRLLGDVYAKYGVL
jgi:4-hydroxy-4-methyl-2-oxoglutarate aldolase